MKQKKYIISDRLDDAIFIVFFIMIISLFSFLFVLQKINTDIFVDTLEAHDIEIIIADIDSPALILSINSEYDFTVRLDLEDTKTVYRQGNSFYIFNQDYTIAWRYTP